MVEFIIEKLRMDELPEAVRVIEATFLKFEAPDYSEEGVANFFQFANEATLREKLQINMKMYAAKVDGRIAGVIGFRNNSHISLLFVLEAYQRNGIARALCNRAMEQCRNAGTDRITVNSSPYAHEVYRKLGFSDTKPMQEVDGIRFHPMHKAI